MRNTLDNFNYDKNTRRTGKSTRQIDLAIQILFEDKEVEIKDHHNDGTHKAANFILLNRVKERLKAEHKNTNFVCNVFSNIHTIKII